MILIIRTVSYTHLDVYKRQAYDKTGEWLPKETLEAIRESLVAIKGPLETPVGGGIRSLNVACLLYTSRCV